MTSIKLQFKLGLVIFKTEKGKKKMSEIEDLKDPGELLITPEILEGAGLKKLRLTLTLPNKFDVKILDGLISARELIRLAILDEAGFKKTNPARIKGRLAVKPGKGKGKGKIDIWKYLRDIVVGRNKNNELIFEANIKKAPVVISDMLSTVLKKPKHIGHLYWQELVFWKLGNLEELTSLLGDVGYLLIVKTGTVLFPDEIKKLQSGEIVVTRNWGGINDQDIGESELIAYAVRKGELYKIQAHSLG